MFRVDTSNIKVERTMQDKTSRKVPQSGKADRSNTVHSEDPLSDEPKAQPPPLKHDFTVQRHASFLKVMPMKQQASLLTKASSISTSGRPSAILVPNAMTKQQSMDTSDQFENSLQLLKEEKNTPMCSEAYPQRLTVFQNSFDVEYSEVASEAIGGSK